MLDIHCHLLPGVDDGPRSWGESLDLCRALVDQGVTCAAATPHVADQVFPNDRASVAVKVAELRERLVAAAIPLEVVSGGEVSASYSHLMLPPFDVVPTLNGGRYVLLELPAQHVMRGLDQLLFRLASRGLRPVLAHPERNREVQGQRGVVEHWVRRGCVVQCDADSFLGAWGRGARRTAEALLRCGLVHALASDAHSCARRPPRLAEAASRIQTLTGEPTVRLLTDEVPRAMVTGGAVRAPVPSETARPSWRACL